MAEVGTHVIRGHLARIIEHHEAARQAAHDAHDAHRTPPAPSDATRDAAAPQGPNPAAVGGPDR